MEIRWISQLVAAVLPAKYAKTSIKDASDAKKRTSQKIPALFTIARKKRTFNIAFNAMNFPAT
jgi:hypothetical protein